MAKKQVFITPEDATLCLSTIQERNLEGYAGYCNAILCTIDYVDGPVWAMQLYNGPVTHWAILEEIGRISYIYIGTLKPQPIIPQNQTYLREIKRGGVKVKQIGYIEYNYDMEVCIRWVDA